MAKQQPQKPEPPVVTGTTLLRAACLQRRTRSTAIAKEVGIAHETLHRFFAEGGTLPPATLCKLAMNLFNNAVEFVPELDKLKTTAKLEPQPLGVYAPPAVGAQLDLTPRIGPQPVKPVPPQPKIKRAGWVE